MSSFIVNFFRNVNLFDFSYSTIIRAMLIYKDNKKKTKQLTLAKQTKKLINSSTDRSHKRK